MCLNYYTCPSAEDLVQAPKRCVGHIQGRAFLGKQDGPSTTEPLAIKVVKQRGRRY